MHPDAATVEVLKPCILHPYEGRDPLAWLHTYGCMLRWRKARSASAPEANPTARRPRKLERMLLHLLPLWTVSGQRPKSHPAGLQVHARRDRRGSKAVHG